LAFLRLRITNSWSIPVLKGCAIIREMHTYGQAVEISKKIKAAQQHKHLGKRLIKQAEKIAKDLKYKKIAVIAGVGVREYYRKLGYRLKNEYMIKNF